MLVGEASEDTILGLGEVDYSQGLPSLGADAPPQEGAVTVTVWSVVGTISAALAAYHGYKRNGGSIGWAAWWALMGGMFGPIPVAIAFAQGFGKRK